MAYVKFKAFANDLLSGKHVFGSDEFRIMLTNVEPNSAVDATTSDITEINVEHGYPAGGLATATSISADGLSWVVDGTNALFEAAGGSFGPFEFAVLYNYTHPDKPLVCYWAYPGGSISLLDTEQLAVTIAATGIFKVT